MTVVRAAAVQMSPVLYSREATVDKVVQKIHELGQRGVQFATFPETVVPYYPYFSFVQSPVQNIAGPGAAEADRPSSDGAVPCHGGHRRSRQAGGSRRIHRRERA